MSFSFSRLSVALFLAPRSSPWQSVAVTFSPSLSNTTGAWPVIGIIGGALVFCGSFISNKIMFHPDVRITPSKRNADIRDWR